MFVIKSFRVYVAGWNTVSGTPRWTDDVAQAYCFADRGNAESMAEGIGTVRRLSLETRQKSSMAEDQITRVGRLAAESGF